MLYQQHLKKNRISHNNSFCFAKLILEQVLKRIGNILRAALKVFFSDTYRAGLAISLQRDGFSKLVTAAKKNEVSVPGENDQ